MSTARPFADREPQHHEDLADVPAGWTLFLGVGGFTILSGLALMVSTFLLSGSTALAAGWIMLAAAAAQLVGSYLGRRWVGSTVAVINGVIYAGIGLTLFADQAGDVDGVMLAAAGLMVAAGLFRMVFPLVKAYTHREISIFNGALGVVVGLMIVAASYGGQIWAVGFILGIDAIVTGVAWTLFAVVLHRVHQGEGRPAGTH